MSSALPPIDSALLPADVRKAGPRAEKLYETALSFEGMLDEQLAQSLTATLQPSEGDSSDGSGGATSIELQQLPSALAQGLVANGGLGVARQLYDALKGANGSGS
jgi:hypothetical protein